MAMASPKSFLISLFILVAVTAYAVSGEDSDSDPQQTIRMLPTSTSTNRIHLVRPDSDPNCESWKFAVEVNAAVSWKSVPKVCVEFVQDYFNSDRYLRDSEAVSKYALDFALTVKIASDAKDAWVFDIDETLLSNLPYYRAHGFGSEPYNETSFNGWVFESSAPALPASLKLFNNLKLLGFKIFLLTGRTESQRFITETNLVDSGFYGWNRLILRGVKDEGKKAIDFKSEKRNELVKRGYRIHGSSGDQWSDLFGYATATRSFKLPNPMYFIA